MSQFQHDYDDDIAIAPEKPKLMPPPYFHVVLLNDDITTMEFVIEILQGVFNKDYDTAVEIMYQIHEKGSGICGTYPHDIAEAKMLQVRGRARKREFPLQCIMRKVQ